ncbi:MAG TPA: ABC transporter permease [Marmoricola sp.]|nr:ABC transporter permease [Marmoricola sp.]HNI70718.1 ABC transporter permease [Marmoricola sp.]HNJ78921.1 ABC transporter permease [Marmoricola sp.]HNO39194.1 ABC transporter permease [Marmoricola sp.]
MSQTKTAGIPFARLVKVEFRKMVDTRAGLWLLIVTAAITALAMFIAAIVSITQDTEISFNAYLMTCAYTSGILLPVLGIMLVTQEWGQRTGMVTFVLEPRRSRVILAKLVTGVLLAWLVVLLAFLVAALSNVIAALGRGASPSWDLDWHFVFAFLFGQTFAMLVGFALAALLLNTPAAIVLFFVATFVLPVVISTVSLTVWKGLGTAQPWFDYSISQSHLMLNEMTGERWAQLGVTTALWVVLPVVLGVLRITRAEVK